MTTLSTVVCLGLAALGIDIIRGMLRDRAARRERWRKRVACHRPDLRFGAARSVDHSYAQRCEAP